MSAQHSGRGTAVADAQLSLAGAVASRDAAWPEDLLGAVVGGGTLDAASALEVYRTGYVVRLTDQLGETYASVWRVVGDEDFFALCADYIAAHPSSSYNLSDYGQGFGDFLDARSAAGDASSRPDAAASPGTTESSAAAADALPDFLAELARFEWDFHDLFHAPPHASVSAAELAALGDLDGVKMHVGSAVRLLACERAVYDVFRHRHADEVPDIEVDRRQWMLLYKQRGDVYAREVDEATFAALEALSRGVVVEEALAAAVACDPAFAEAEAARLFEILALTGLVAAISR